jgi:hypothetical protein
MGAAARAAGTGAGVVTGPSSTGRARPGFVGVPQLGQKRSSVDSSVPQLWQLPTTAVASSRVSACASTACCSSRTWRSTSMASAARRSTTSGRDPFARFRAS